MQGFSWISFSWKPSKTHMGIPYLSFHIILIKEKKTEWNVTIRSSQPHANVTGLRPLTKFSFRVVAVSRHDRVNAESGISSSLIATTQSSSMTELGCNNPFSVWVYSICMKLSVVWVQNFHKNRLLVSVFDSLYILTWMTIKNKYK